MKNLTVTSVQKIASNLERVVLASDEAEVTLDLKNPSLHGKHKVGQKKSVFGKEEKEEK